MKAIRQNTTLLAWTPDPEHLIERAGRTCYKSEMNDPVAFIRMIIKRGHESVLEHASATFLIVTDRGISHEIVRHRLASYSQESTRYCNYAGKEMEYIPNAYIPHHVMEVLEDEYNKMVEAGAKPQEARDILPTCLKTELVMTANFREWRHFLKLRLSMAAHPKIREIACLILADLNNIAPTVFEDI